ncbi:MAG: ATP-dependent Clp protease adaptor ClpS [Polyangiaceae bacterium]|nr:ATP-dependent Clp protease adaptor ClpS [Polyangiaceae bacterium]
MPKEFEGDLDVATEKKSRVQPKKPPLYRVLLHNDDYTTREFVVFVLNAVFHRSESEAVRIMLHVHHTGVGVAGVYTHEIAETKIQTVERMAREQEFPLRLSMEPEEEEN